MMGVCRSKIASDPPKNTVRLGPLSCSECKDLLRSLPSYTPKLIHATCIKVTDGDSIRVRARLACDANTDRFYQFVLRLYGIDTPELRTKCTYEKKFALMAKSFLEEKILGRYVDVSILSRGKFGRLLAVVHQYHDTKSVNQTLVEQGYAVKYDGGKRVKRSSEEFKQLILDNSR